MTAGEGGSGESMSGKGRVGTAADGGRVMESASAGFVSVAVGVVVTAAGWTPTIVPLDCDLDLDADRVRHLCSCCAMSCGFVSGV